ncbi:MAG: hypothetical protein ACXWL2_04470 [Candidatus Chromulinivorax sp.]
MNKVGIILLFTLVVQSPVIAIPFVMTFINKTDITINIQVNFSDLTSDKKGISMDQSYQVVNFEDKLIESINFSSPNKDKNGNFYEQLDYKFVDPKEDTTYHLALQLVPAHQVAATKDTPAFSMPDTKKIICTKVNMHDQKNKKRA